MTYSTSTAQLHWTKDPSNPILSGGDPGSWNRSVLYPMILYYPDSARYEMWFTASSKENYSWPNRIGFATSPDGITWTMLDTTVLEPDEGTWDETTVECPVVLKENGQYKMWYSCWQNGSIPGIGYATSDDGVNWTKYLGNPMFGPGTEPWEAGGASFCTVMPVQGGGYKMWYAGFNNQGDYTAIGYAESEDGITWQRPLNNPVLTPGSSGEWDDRLIFVGAGGFLFHNGIYYMWYTGGRGWGNPQWQIGLACSNDGITWTKYNDTTTTNHPYKESDPVLSPSPGQWDGDCIESGTVILTGDTLHMWYDGWKEPAPPNLAYIGHATIPLDPVIEWGETVLGIEELDHSFIPKVYSLSQSYPNPFNPSTTIEFNLPKSEFTTLKVYNILGKEVTTIVSKKLNQGNHTYTFDGKHLASGVYYYRLEAGDFVQTRKMIYLK